MSHFPAASGRALVVAALVLVLFATSGCLGPDRGADPSPFNSDSYVEDEKTILAEVQELRHGKRIEDPSSSAIFDAAVIKLTARGTMVERYLIEALRGDEDWGVRYGVIQVIDSVGTKKSMEPLIEALEDDHPLVAQKAMYTLRVFTDHRLVPATPREADAEMPEPATVVLEDGTEVTLPPIPRIAPEDYDPDAEYRLWVTWWNQHKQDLRVAWATWYQQNSSDVVLE
jgi:hypothetical protein